ncbi:MAG: hypothetical protein Q8P39_03955 [Candidatus Yanofskybacteria bacterium]|nr:hypothetical protein [Candidatus Yanofskybacteria bacterium]
MDILVAVLLAAILVALGLMGGLLLMHLMRKQSKMLVVLAIMGLAVFGAWAIVTKISGLFAYPEYSAAAFGLGVAISVLLRADEVFPTLSAKKLTP